MDVIIRRVDDADVDAMGSLVGKQPEPRGLWQAIDHWTGTVLAYVCGRRTDEVFLSWKAPREPLGIRRFHTDVWGPYARHLGPAVHPPGKRNTQPIERQHLTVRTRLQRLACKTMCFSKSIQMHDIVIGRLVNRAEFGLSV